MLKQEIEVYPEYFVVAAAAADVADAAAAAWKYIAADELTLVYLAVQDLMPLKRLDARDSVVELLVM